MANQVDFVVVVVIDGKVHTAVPTDFTEKQRAAIMHIMYHIGKDPAPPVPGPVGTVTLPALDEAQAVALLEGGPAAMVDKVAQNELYGRVAAIETPTLSPQALNDLGGQSRHDTGFDNGRDHPPAKTAADTNHEKAAKTQVARQSGYTGDSCTRCGSMQVKRNGSCTVCESCGETTGCS